MCQVCNEIDNESHRINHCPRWSHVNRCQNNDKFDFTQIDSSDAETLKTVASEIHKIWQIEFGKNEIWARPVEA